jgi:hypothetical protein
MAGITPGAVMNKNGWAELESMLWISVLIILLGAAFQIQRHYQQKSNFIIKEFLDEWRRTEKTEF